MANTDRKDAGQRAEASRDAGRKDAKQPPKAPKPSGDSPKPHGDPFLHGTKDKED